MLYLAMIEDDPARVADKPQHQAAHVAYLDGNSRSGTLAAAGPMLDPDSGAQIGAMWSIEAPSAGEARKVVESDPFYKAGIRKSVRLMQWKQVFKDGKKIG